MVDTTERPVCQFMPVVTGRSGLYKQENSIEIVQDATISIYAPCYLRFRGRSIIELVSTATRLLPGPVSILPVVKPRVTAEFLATGNKSGAKRKVQLQNGLERNLSADRRATPG